MILKKGESKFEVGDKIFLRGIITKIKNQEVTISPLTGADGYKNNVIFDVERHESEFSKLIYLNKIKIINFKSPEKCFVVRLSKNTTFKKEITINSQTGMCIDSLFDVRKSGALLNIENVTFNCPGITINTRVNFKNCKFSGFKNKFGMHVGSLNIKLPEFINCKFESKNVSMYIHSMYGLHDEFDDLFKQLTQKKPLDMDIPNSKWNPLDVIYNRYGSKNYPNKVNKIYLKKDTQVSQEVILQYKPKVREYGDQAIKDTGWIISLGKF